MSRAPSTHSTTHGWPTNTQTQRDREARAAAAAATAVAATLPTTPCLCTSILLWHCAIKIVPISYTLYNHSDGQKASEWKHMGPAQADSSADSSDLPFLSKLTSSAVGMLVCKCLVDVGKTGKKRKKKEWYTYSAQDSRRCPWNRPLSRSCSWQRRLRRRPRRCGL